CSSDLCVIIFYCHFILRQSTCLIGTDHRYTAQSFYCLKLADNSMFFSHFLCSKRKYNRNNGTQCLRNCRNCQGNRKEECVSYGFSPEYTDSKQDRTENKDQYGKFLSKVIQVHLQRCLFLRSGL